MRLTLDPLITSATDLTHSVTRPKNHIGNRRNTLCDTQLIVLFNVATNVNTSQVLMFFLCAVNVTPDAKSASNNSVQLFFHGAAQQGLAM